jgi:TorA maturation chaperone TorD
MATNSQLLSLMNNREQFYRFLSRIYKVEVDQALLDNMKKMTFPSQSKDEELNQGYQMLSDYLQNCGEEALEDLAVDYAKVFLGAGVYEVTAAFPFASVYTSKKKIVMQEARDRAVAIYASKGLAVDNESIDFPEDHIALLLEYMAFLCNEAINTLKQEQVDTEALQSQFKEQLSFLDENLLNWIPVFCKDIGKYAETLFYKGIGKITRGYLERDISLLESLIKE